MVLFYQEKATSKVSPKSILNYRTLSGLLKQSQVGIRQHLSEWSNPAIPRENKKTAGTKTSDKCTRFLTAPCKLGQLRSMSLWVLWSGSGSVLSEGATRLDRIGLPPPGKQCLCSHHSGLYNLESVLGIKHPRSPLNRLVLSPERRSALIPILHLQKCKGFLQKTWLKLAMFQFYTSDILIVK